MKMNSRSVLICALVACSLVVVVQSHDHHHDHHHDHGHRHLQQSWDRCGTERQSMQAMLQVEQDIKEWRKLNGCTSVSCPVLENQPKTTISVYWHNIRTSAGTGGISDTMIADSMTVLNNAYSNTGFSFSLASTTTTDNDDYYSATPGTTAQDNMKSALRQGDARALNVYSSGIDQTSGILGYATFPMTYSVNPSDDGVVIGTQTSPGGTSSPYNEGDTLVHEVGHWLGLYHTFQCGCFGCGDFVDDTPCQSTPTNGCPADKDTCVGGGADLVDNYMDYSTDVCMTSFTSGQITRMQEQWNTYRSSGGRFAPATRPNYIGYGETLVTGFFKSVEAAFKSN